MTFAAMPNEQMVMGVAVAAVSLIAFLKTGWLLQHTAKGEWFVRRFGELKARLYVRSFFFFTAALGVLLAANVIRPMQW